MSLAELDTYAISIQSPGSTTPAIIDAWWLIALMEKILKTELHSIDDLSEQWVSNIFLYEVEEDKKHFDILTARRVARDTELKPYEGKNIYILREFDTATLEAQNALLKTLEDHPDYVVILLVVESPSGLLDTIRSRVLDLSMDHRERTLSQEEIDLLDQYLWGNRLPWIEHLFSSKYARDDAIQILSYVYDHVGSDMQDTLTESIEILSRTYENPRNILDVFFLGEILPV